MEYAALALTGIAAGGQILKGVSEQKSQREQARISEEQAAFERARANVDAGEMRAKASRIAGADRARRAASGVDVNSGSPLAIDLETTVEGEFSAQKILRDGETRAFRLEQESQLRKRAGHNAFIGGFFNAGTTALSGLSSFAKLAPAGESAGEVPKTRYSVPKLGYDYYG